MSCNEVSSVSGATVQVRLMKPCHIVSKDTVALIHWGPCTHFQFNMSRDQARELAAVLLEVADQ